MKNPTVQLLLGVALSALFLYFALRGVSPQDLWLAVSNFNWVWAFPFLLLTFFSLWVRAWRWKYLLQPTINLTSARLFSPMMIGFAINSLLPARAGEFARAYVLAKKENLTFGAVFGTIVVERIFDSITLLILLAAVLGNLDFDAAVSYSYSTRGQLSYDTLTVLLALVGGSGILAAMLMAMKAIRGNRSTLRNTAIALCVISSAFLVAIPLLAGKEGVYEYGSDFVLSGETLRRLSRQITVACFVMLAGVFLLLWEPARNFFQKLAESVPYAPRSIRIKISGLIEAFAQGLTSLKSGRLIAIVFIQSVIVWALVAWSFKIMPYGIEDMRMMSMTEATALLVISCIAIIIPAAPGYWGLMELGIIFGLKILDVESDASRALAYSLLVHSLQYFPIVAVGLFYLGRERVKFAEISRRQEQPK